MPESETQTLSDTALPDSCFAFVPSGGAPSDRKLKLCDDAGKLDADIIGAAAAALSSGGFRGNRVQLPDSARAGVVAKVRSAWRKVNPSKSDAEMPAGMKMAEDGAEDGAEGAEPIAIYAVKRAASERPHTYLPVAFAEPPEWSPFLPIPGTYSHPTYGDLTYTPDVYDRMVANFHSGAYQDRLPVNAEHDPHAAGAIGWIVDMRLSDSGAIEVKVDWNQRGRALIEGDRYRYVSAEVMPTWVDPVEPDHIYEDVAVGMAITTRPFFKQRVLPPLAASEAALTYAGDGMEDEMPEQDTKDTKDTDTKDIEEHAEPTKKTVAQRSAELTTIEMTEEAVAKFKEMQRQVAEQGRQLITLAEENAALRQDVRAKEFTDEVKGRADDNRNPWIGSHENHISMLTDLAEKFGKDSKQVHQYISVNRGQAELARTSTLFQQIGISRGGENTADARIETLAKARMQSDPSLTYQQAATQVLKEQPGLYDAQQRGQ